MDSLPEPWRPAAIVPWFCRGQGTSCAPLHCFGVWGVLLPCSCWGELAPASRLSSRPCWEAAWQAPEGSEQAAQHQPAGYHGASPPHISLLMPLSTAGPRPGVGGGIRAES